MSHRRLLPVVLALATLTAFAIPPGTLAPDFKGVDSNGVTHRLSDYRGK